MTFGTCRYCGQVVNLDYEEETQAEADIAASEKCECYDARHERNLRKQITAAQNRIRKIFGGRCCKAGLCPDCCRRTAATPERYRGADRTRVYYVGYDQRARALQGENHDDHKRENQGRAQRNENVPVGGMTANERSV